MVSFCCLGKNYKCHTVLFCAYCINTLFLSSSSLHLLHTPSSLVSTLIIDISWIAEASRGSTFYETLGVRRRQKVKAASHPRLAAGERGGKRERARKRGRERKRGRGAGGGLWGNYIHSTRVAGKRKGRVQALRLWDSLQPAEAAKPASSFNHLLQDLFMVASRTSICCPYKCVVKCWLIPYRSSIYPNQLFSRRQHQKITFKYW